MKSISPKLYFFTLFVTICIFVSALIVSNYFTKKKTEELKAVEDKVTVDILSYETQLDVIKNASSCATLPTATLRSELGDLSNRLAYMEQQVGPDDPDVFRLKRYYSLLEMRDYLLTKQAATECKFNSILVLYFYSTKNCPECTTQEYILRAIQDEYPDIRVYSFDYNLDLSAVKTLITLHNIPPNPPVIDINGKAYAGFNSLADMEAVLQPFLHPTTTQAVGNSTKK